MQIVPALDGGGAERTTFEIARAIVEAGGRALVASEGGRLESDIKAAGGEIFHLPVASKNPITMLANAERLAELAETHGADILHARSRAPAWSAVWATKKLRAKGRRVHLVGTYHGAYAVNFFVKKLYNSSLTRGDLIIANSEFTASSIRAQYAPPQSKLRTIPRGADLSFFDPESVGEERICALVDGWGLPQRPSVDPPPLKILAVGRLTPWKGQEDILKALSLIRQGGRFGASPNSVENGAGAQMNFEVAFCGGAQGTESFTRLFRDEITATGLDDVAMLVGDCKDMAAAYAWSDIVMAPSRRPEAFGRAVVEAGAMGKPVIACDHGGALETVIDGKTGILVSPNDPEALADALYEMVKMGKSGRVVMGTAARRYITENYSVDAMCAATLFAYNDLLTTG